MQAKYLIDTLENKKFLEDVRNSLFNFGHKFPSPGGGSYYLGDDGTPWKERSRETWITSRMVHVYSMASFLGHEGSAELADAGLKGLLGELHDTKNGGWYAGLTADGEILPNKQCYAHAFVILASSSAVIAGRPGAKELLDEALALYDERFWNEEEGLSCDTWNTEFTVLDDYRGLNANMHTVEAFLAAADVTGDEKYRVRAGRIIDNVAVWAAENNYRIPEHFSKEWVADLDCNKEKPDDPFKPYGATPGHGLEWARLITQWAMSTYGDKVSAVKYIDLAENLFNRAVEDAWNADGAKGVVYTTDWDGKPVVHDRMHWTLAEAINTAAVLYRVTGDETYADYYAEFMLYLDETVLDHVNGSWFHQLDQNNNLLGTVWPGKSDLYHAVQATLIPYHPVELSIAPAVKAANTGYDVVALGELLIDFAMSGASEQGNNLFEACPGGAPCNVLAMLNKLSKKTAFIGKVGNDQFGKLLKETIEEIGIDAKGLLMDEDVRTTLAFVHTFPDGDRDFSFYRNPGADMMLKEDEVDYDMIRKAKVFHLGTLSMTDEPVRSATKKALDVAKEAGCIISFDPNLRPPLWKSLDTAKEMMEYGFGYCDILKISDNEIQFVSGKEDYDEGIQYLIEKYNIPLIFLTLGKDGSRAYYKGMRVEEAGFKVNAIETTGAGDTFCGSVISGVLDKGLDSLTAEDLSAILKFANAAAAVVTTKKGAIRAMPNPEEVYELMK